jgi:hypothetical protein
MYSSAVSFWHIFQGRYFGVAAVHIGGSHEVDRSDEGYRHGGDVDGDAFPHFGEGIVEGLRGCDYNGNYSCDLSPLGIVMFMAEDDQPDGKRDAHQIHDQVGDF